MGRRALAPLTALAVLLAGGCGSAARELEPGDTIPAEWAADAGAGRGTTVVWLFRTDDCLRCQSFDFAVRRLQAAYGDTVPFVAVHVGSPEREQVPRSFFRARRISVARMVTLSPRSFGRSWRRDALPALLVVHGRRVVWTSALPQGVATAAQVDSIVSGALRAPPPSAGAAEGR